MSLLDPEWSGAAAIRPAEMELPPAGCVCRHQGGGDSVTQSDRALFHDGLVPQTGIDKGLQQPAPALYQQGLQSPFVECLQQRADGSAICSTFAGSGPDARLQNSSVGCVPSNR